jgi:hypothetical protein
MDSRKQAEKTIEGLAPSHITEQLPENPDELVEELKQDAGAETREEGPKEDPRSEEEWTFHFKWQSPKGILYAGSFTNRILSVGDKQAAGIMQAKLGAGMPSDSLDPLTSELNFIISRLSFSLTDKPDWAKNLRDIKEVPLLQALYTEVASHEAIFFGLEPVEAGSGV